MLSRVLLFLFVTSIATSTLAQDRQVIVGKVVDATTKNPVPFATIRLKQITAGVISNVDGSFQIPIRFKSLDKFIVISCIGYVSREISLESLRTDDINTVELRQAVTVLSEVMVRSKKHRLNAKEIVELAIQQIKTNTPQQPFSYIGYYRDYQKCDGRYLNLNEALLDVMDKGFQTNDQVDTQLALMTLKQSSAFQRDEYLATAYDNATRKFVPSSLMPTFGGNELSILRVHDPIRNKDLFSYSFVDVLEKNFVNNHNFKLRATTYSDKIPLYVVEFDTRDYVTRAKFVGTGKIYIEHTTFAIHKIEYSTFSRKDGQRKLLYRIDIEYRKSDPLMYLNYISFNNLFEVPDSLNYAVKEITVNRVKNALQITFTQNADGKTTFDRDNYKIKLDGTPLEIADIQIVRGSPKQILVYFRESERPRIATVSEQSVPDIDIKNLLSAKGRKLGEVNMIEAYQFRELFVQRLDKDIPVEFDSLLLKKDVPLAESPQVPWSEGTATYWMNTPLKSY